MCDRNPNWPLINCWLLLLSSFVFACKPEKRIWHTYVKSHGALYCTFIWKGFYCGPEQLKKNNRNEFGGRSDSCGSKIQVVPKNYYNLYFYKPKAKLRYHHCHFCHHQHHHHHYYLGYNAIKALWKLRLC